MWSMLWTRWLGNCFGLWQILVTGQVKRLQANCKQAGHTLLKLHEKLLNQTKIWKCSLGPCMPNIIVIFLCCFLKFDRVCQQQVSHLTNQCHSYLIKWEEKENFCFALFGSNWWHCYHPHLWLRIYSPKVEVKKGAYTIIVCGLDVLATVGILFCSSLKTLLVMADHFHSIFSRPAAMDVINESYQPGILERGWEVHVLRPRLSKAFGLVVDLSSFSF